MYDSFKNENNRVLNFLRNIYFSFIPNKKDNLKQMLVKLMFLVSCVILIISSSYIAKYFLTAKRQNDIIDNGRRIWHNSINQSGSANTVNPYALEALIAENSDFKGWITIDGTKVDNPVYQTNDNNYYLTHNQKKQRSVYGALFFDCKNKITENETDKNLVIYGHEMKNGTMFGSLKKYKSLNFYKEHPIIEFTTLYKKSTYKIYAIFILNSKKEDDGGYIYNIYRQNFYSEDDFYDWTAEAFERSIININVDVEYGDNILTLVTCAQDFEDARLVIMAREVRYGESGVTDTTTAVVNPKPRYPERWYKR